MGPIFRPTVFMSNGCLMTKTATELRKPLNGNDSSNGVMEHESCDGGTSSNAVGQTATVNGTIFNLTKNCVGSTVLASSDAFQYAGSIPVFLLIMVANVALHAVIYFLMCIGCSKTGAKCFRDWWIAANGKDGILILDFLLIVNGFSSLIAYVILVGDFATKSLVGLFPNLPVLHHWSLNVLTICFGILLPLALKRELSSIAEYSKFGLLCALYAVVFVVIDCISHEGPLHQTLSMQPVPASELQFISAFGLLFASAGSQVLTPRFYAELKDGTPAKYTSLAVVAKVIAHSFYLIFGVFGYLRFGMSPPRIQGNILANYTEASKWELIAWMGMALNTVPMFPLQLAPVRDSSLGILRAIRKRRGRAESRSDDWDFNVCTIMLVVLSFLCAVRGVQLNTINLLKGLFAMPLLCAVIPSVLYRKSVSAEEARGFAGKCSWVVFVIGLAVLIDGPRRMFNGIFSPGSLDRIVHGEIKTVAFGSPEK